MECPFCGEKFSSNSKIIQMQDGQLVHSSCLIERIENESITYEDACVRKCDKESTEEIF